MGHRMYYTYACYKFKLKGGNIMDFRQNLQNVVSRPTEPAQQAVGATGSVAPSAPTVKAEDKKGKFPSWLNVLSVTVLVGAVLLILLTAVSFTRTNVENEGHYVNTSLYQAVFLNNGQVYFGKVKSINSRYINLASVYYLTQSSTATTTTAASQSNSDYTLVKLGCQQIHYPNDQMIISRDQVTFWENLNSSGKVAKSIADYVKQYPNGNCSTAATTTQTPTTNLPAQSGTNTTTPATTTTTPAATPAATTPATTTTTKPSTTTTTTH